MASSDRKSTSQSRTDDNDRSKSCTTNCSSNSSCFFKRRRPMNPLAYPVLKPKPLNPVKQRVLSARLLKLRQLQNQLNDANYHLAEVARENQTLKTLQKRQDKALSKYENADSDLPRLIRTYEEDVRVLNEKNRLLKKQLRETMEQLKLREDEMGKLKDQLAKLEKLDKDKRLSEREKLADRVDDLTLKLSKSDEQVTILNRKLLLESKASKQRLNAEIAKHKQCQKELLHAFSEIDRLTALVDAYPIRSKHPKVPFPPKRLNDRNPVTEVKLQPLINDTESTKFDENCGKIKLQNGFRAPIENIKQRLSNGSLHINNSTNGEIVSDSRELSSGGSFKSRPTSSVKLEKLPQMKENGTIRAKEKTKTIDEKDYDVRQADDEVTDNENFGLDNFMDTIQKMKRNKQEQLKNSRKSSIGSSSIGTEPDVEKKAENLDKAISKATENSQDDFDKNLSQYCSSVLENVKTCARTIELHKDTLEVSKTDTQTLLETFQKTEKAETKLKHSFFNIDNDDDDDDTDLMKEILNEERKFQLENQTKHNGTLVNLDSKKKLLATLRAIDNGDSVDSLDEPRQKTHVLTEMFGNVAL